MSECHVESQVNARIERVKFADLESHPSWLPMLDEYADECQLAGMPRAECQSDMYRAMEQYGALHSHAVYVGDDLAGFCFLLISTLPHYGKVVGTTESIFVRQAYRHTGAGLALVRAIEKYAREQEAIAMIFSAPKGGRMEQLMPALGYANTNLVFFKGLE
jgi:GNAT superfamily N-acetyltransferase